MRPKDYLKQIQKLEYAIYMTEEEILRIRAQLDIKGVNYDGDKVKSSPKDSVPEMISRLVDLENQNNERRKSYENLRSKIFMQIGGMEDQLEIAILYLHYVKELSLVAVAEKTAYSYEWIKHVHGIALKHFEEKYAPLEKLDT